MCRSPAAAARVGEADGQLRFWPLWWHLSKARHRPALLDKLPGPGIRRIWLSGSPKAGLTSTSVKRHGAWQTNLVGLNFGNCLSYALALDTREPLLWKGDDFGHTGIASALKR